MIQLKIKTPYTFLGQVRNDLCVVYAENEKGVRYNIKQKESDNECASCLCEYKENILDEFEITENKTLNPQEI